MAFLLDGCFVRKKWVAVLVGVSVVGGVLWWRGSGAVKAEVGGGVKMVVVDQGEVRQVVMASGKISANYEVDIKCKASGEVMSLPFDVSDFVKKGYAGDAAGSGG